MIQRTREAANPFLLGVKMSLTSDVLTLRSRQPVGNLYPVTERRARQKFLNRHHNLLRYL